jgi:hypothetical protein
MSMFMLMCKPKGDDMKIARLHVLTTPAFRDWLRKEASKAGISVGELVRGRCERRVGDEEAALEELTALLRKEVTATRTVVRRNLDEPQAILNDLRARRRADSVEDRAWAYSERGLLPCGRP